ncbi:LacI family DNA-binding transcriptional regulator [Arthrobacter sp. B0490]|uniref:LacI family DNA-binding transcriptional regulator n=1 Tax=Arthrobacter sp. B0490 TaxID=2058891 RepID=UPI000CE54534|nr:substrate-binding domain-containing protein [Arthrobacter sp. B0490]
MADRRRGCEEALQAAGLTLPEELIATGPHGLEGGAKAMAELMSRPVLPTAVFAEYDELAIGAMWALRRAGLSVPGDISIISADDHEMAAMFDLTTIAQDVVGQGAIAAQLLLQALGAQKVRLPDPPVLVPTWLVLRGTTAPRGDGQTPARTPPLPAPLLTLAITAMRYRDLSQPSNLGLRPATRRVLPG